MGIVVLLAAGCGLFVSCTAVFVVVVGACSLVAGATMLLVSFVVVVSTGRAQAHARKVASCAEIAWCALLRATLQERQSAVCAQRTNSSRAAAQRSSSLRAGKALTNGGTASALSVVA